MSLDCFLCQVGTVQENVVEIQDEVLGMGITIETLEIEQSLQDQRLLTLEQTSDSMAVNVFELQGDVEGRISDCSARNKDHNKSRKH